MTVSCEGDCRIIDATWEKQDFEVELTIRGYSHDDFHLVVKRLTPARAEFGLRYVVTVHNRLNDAMIEYPSSLSASWVGRFAVDLAKGLFGEATNDGRGA